MATWLDRFTGQRYSLDEEQHDAIRRTVGQAIAAELRPDRILHEQANAVAQWWQTDYYERVFPLRFGRQPQGVFTEGAQLGYASADGALALPNNAQWAHGVSGRDCTSRPSCPPRRSPTWRSPTCSRQTIT
jgi:hypothetical protein